MFELSGFCGGANAIAFTPTAIDNIDYVEIQNGEYNDLMLTRDTDFEITNSIPEWSFDTALYGRYSMNTNAGNVDWNVKTVNALMVKSRPVGTFEWKTITVKEIKTIDDFEINYADYFVPSGQPTEYALVPLLYGAEGTYESTQIKPIYDRIFVIDADEAYSTNLIDGGITITRNIPSANVELLNSKYPIFVRNTIANYDTGQASGIWIPSSGIGCDMAETLDPEFDFERVAYQQAFIEFLANSRPKIIKDDVGHLWVSQITPNITDSPGSAYNDRKIEFMWVEVASAQSPEDLYYLGLSDVSEEWW